ncbi:hypothetical protein HBH46_217920, partial [Parastagonospora nodorum]
ADQNNAADQKQQDAAADEAANAGQDAA